MTRIIRNVVVTRHGGFAGHVADETADEAALRALVASLGLERVQALLAALGPGDEDDEGDADEEAEIEAANSSALGPMRLLLAPPNKKPAAERTVTNDADEPAVLGLSPAFLLGGKR